MEVVSVFEVTDSKTGEQFVEPIIGMGQEAIGFLRKDYPRYSKFVLKGFEIEGDFQAVNLRTYNKVK
jgi:hypothetical protein